MICLSLVATTIAQNLRSVARHASNIDLVELRADFLLPEEREQVDRFPSMLPLGRDGTALQAILTVRTPEDGGHWNDGETERRHMLLHGLRCGGYRYVDLEARLRGTDAELLDVAAEAGTTVIRSIHDFSGVPPNLAEFLGDEVVEGEIPKAAVMPRSMVELARFFRTVTSLPDRPRIIVAMGTVGFPARVLARRLGSILTFCSPDRDETDTGEADRGVTVVAAPGHVDPATMSTLYRYRDIDARTAVFGVIGNPVMHSRSPQYHNRRLAEEGLAAVYLPFEVDDVDAFMELADLVPILGFSVTLPHKEEVIRHLAHADAAVTAVGACNTVVGPPGARAGYNTDVEGFLAPLRETVGAPGLCGMSATVVGAGGAARAVVYGLLREGVHVLIVNRTADRAASLARELSGIAAVNALTLVVAELGTVSEARIRQFSDIIVQTTSVGMEPEIDADPLDFYPFNGVEVVCDIVYTPPITRILERAAAAGCRTLPGTHMFDAQADAQYQRYRQIAADTAAL